MLPILRIGGNYLKLLRGFWFVASGRALTGLTAGILNSQLGKVLSDTVPKDLFYIYGLSINSGTCFGLLLIGFISAVLVPLKEDGAEVLMHD